MAGPTGLGFCPVHRINIRCVCPAIYRAEILGQPSPEPAAAGIYIRLQVDGIRSDEGNNSAGISVPFPGGDLAVYDDLFSFQYSYQLYLFPVVIGVENTVGKNNKVFGNFLHLCHLQDLEFAALPDGGI